MTVEPPPPPPPHAATEERAEQKAKSSFADRQDEAAAANATTADRARDKDDGRLQSLKKSTPAGYGANSPASPSAIGGAEARNLDKLEVQGSRIQRETDTEVPEESLSRTVPKSVDDDARLSPSQWIARIRDRVRMNDTQGARDSLRRFNARYPDAAIPDDLLPLLR
jgi:hypothetical protein